MYEKDNCDGHGNEKLKKALCLTISWQNKNRTKFSLSSGPALEMSCCSDLQGNQFRKKLRYFRLPPNLAQRRLIDLANHTPSFVPYKAVVITCEVFESGSAMASGSRSSREQTFDIEKAVRRVLEEETDNGGMPSDEESDLDNQLYDLDNNWR